MPSPEIQLSCASLRAVQMRVSDSLRTQQIKSYGAALLTVLKSWQVGDEQATSKAHQSVIQAVQAVLDATSSEPKKG